eukprot:gene11538-21763_t
MRLLYFTLICGLAIAVAPAASLRHRLPKTIRTFIDTPSSSTETPDSSTETPNSDTETSETPETPDTTADIPDTPETPDSKAVVPASPQSSDISIDDEESGSGHEDPTASNIPGSKPQAQSPTELKSSKKQLLGYPEPDGGQQEAMGDFGQGGPPGQGLGGLGRGGLGSEIEGMPVGMGAGGEPLGYRERQEGFPGQNFHIPGIAAPSNYGDNAEVGRNNDDDNGMIGRYTESDDVDTMTQRAITKINGVDDDSPNGYSKESMYSNVEPDMSVTKAIGRPFQPDGEPAGGNMDEREDSPFQAVRQESPFQIPMNSIAAQASYAQSQMSRFRPESAGPFGPQQEESPFQPQPGEGPEEENDIPEGGPFRATSMNGAEAMLGMSEQEGMKRHFKKKAGRKALLASIKRKRTSKQGKSQLKKRSR